MVQVTRSRTVLDLYSWLYEVYCESGLNDLGFNCFAVWAIKRAMNRRGMADNFAEMRDALRLFEFELDPADPAYCHHMKHVLYKVQKSL